MVLILEGRLFWFGLIFSESLNRYTSMYNHAASDVEEEYFTLSSVGYDFEDGGFY